MKTKNVLIAIMLLGNGLILALIAIGIQDSASDDTKELKLVHIVSYFLSNLFIYAPVYFYVLYQKAINSLNFTKRYILKNLQLYRMFGNRNFIC